MQHFLKVWFLFVLPSVQTWQSRVVGAMLPRQPPGGDQFRDQMAKEKDMKQKNPVYELLFIRKILILSRLALQIIKKS